MKAGGLYKGIMDESPEAMKIRLARPFPSITNAPRVGPGPAAHRP